MLYNRIILLLKNRLFLLISLGQLLLDLIELLRGDILHKSHIQDRAVTYPVVCITVTFHQKVVTTQLSRLRMFT